MMRRPGSSPRAGRRPVVDQIGTLFSDRPLGLYRNNLRFGGLIIPPARAGLSAVDPHVWSPLVTLVRLAVTHRSHDLGFHATIATVLTLWSVFAPQTPKQR